MILMHKNIPVAKIKLVNNIPIFYEEIINKEHLPIGTKGNGPEQDKILLNHWYQSRSIPNLRPNLSNIEKSIGLSKTEAFIKSAGVSITDTYWLKEKDQNIIWENINYHDNGFSPIFADYYANNKLNFAPSPDFTTDGIMEKFWLPVAGQPHLFKFDTQYNNILCANEIVYFKIADALGIKTTPYFSGKSEIGNYCFCPCFLNKSDCDFINAMQIKHSPDKTNIGTLYFTKTGEKLIRYFMNELGFERQIKEMITLDCLFHNTDRHERNFGYILFEDGTKEFVPLFDNSYCLGVNRDEYHLMTDGDMKLFSQQRNKILEEYGITISLDENFCFNILESAYQEFDIPEKRYEIAKEELEFGISLMKQNRIKIFPGYESSYSEIDTERE